METKILINALRECKKPYTVILDVSAEMIADRLEELESKNAELKKQLSEKPEWISVEDGKEMPDAISYTGIRHDQFPRLVIATDENRIVTHWMMLDAPKPKEPTFKDVFLEKFPKVQIDERGIPRITCCTVFPYLNDGRNICQRFEYCYECWNQPYFEEEGEEDA